MQDLADGAPATARADAADEQSADGADGLDDAALFDEGDDGFDRDAGERADDDFGDGFDDDFASDLDADSADELDAGDGPLRFEDGLVNADDALLDAMADALVADDGDSFLRGLIGGATRVFQQLLRSVGGARGLSRAAGQVVRTAGRAAQQVGGALGQAANSGALNQVREELGQVVAQGGGEAEAFESMADLYADEGFDEALPVLGMMAARTALRPLMRRQGAQLSRAARRQIARQTTQAARALIHRVGPVAARALPRIARSVGRVAARRRMRPEAVAGALQRTLGRLARDPALRRRLLRIAQASPRRSHTGRGPGRLPRRLVVHGPVEIVLHQR